MVTTKEDILKRWEEYCSELYDFDLNVEEATLDDLWQGQDQETPPLLEVEVDKAIGKLKTGKSAGIDGVCSVLIRSGGRSVSKELYNICQMAWHKEEFPEIWTKSIIITLPKKGDLTRCENHRTISLIPHASKVLLEVIRTRLKPFIETQMSEEQAGFRPNRSTIEQIFVWRQLAERYLEVQSREIVNVFIDFKKAFDRVWHQGMFRILEHYNIPTKLLNLIKSLYSQAVSAVRVGTDISGWFRQAVGVRQGCVLSPDLFNLFLEHILRIALEEVGDGVVANGLYIPDLRFADDITLLDETVEASQNKLQLVYDASRRFGLEISEEKTKCLLVSNNHHDLHIEMNNVPITEVTHFKYLGTEVTPNNDCSLDIKCRTAQALAASAKLQSIWRNDRISIFTKLRLHNSLIMPTALYGCENWTISAANLRKLKSFEMKCLRRILNITWQQRISNAEVSRRSGVEEGNIIKIIRLRQRKWLGRILNMEAHRLPKITLQSHHLDRRRRGRPRLSWLSGVLQPGTTLSEISRTADFTEQF